MTTLSTLLGQTSVGANIADWLYSIVKPLFLVIWGGGAVTYLLRREMSQFIAFLGVGVVVGSIIFFPTAWQGLAEGFGQLLTD